MNFSQDDFGEFHQSNVPTSFQPSNQLTVQKNFNNIQQNSFQSNYQQKKDFQSKQQQQQKNVSARPSNTKIDLNSKIFASLDLKTTQAPVKFKPAISQITKRKEVPSFHNASAKAADWTSLKFDDTAFYVEPELPPPISNTVPTNTINTNDNGSLFETGFTGSNHNVQYQSNQQSNMFEDEEFNDFQQGGTDFNNQQTTDNMFNMFNTNITSTMPVQQQVPLGFGQDQIFQGSQENIFSSNNYNSSTVFSSATVQPTSFYSSPSNQLFKSNISQQSSTMNTTSTNQQQQHIAPSYFDGQNNLFQSNQFQHSFIPTTNNIANPVSASATTHDNNLYSTNQQCNVNAEKVQPTYNFDGQENLFQSYQHDQPTSNNTTVQFNSIQSNEKNDLQTNQYDQSEFTSNSIQDTDFVGYEYETNSFKETEFGSTITTLDQFTKETSPPFENTGQDNLFKETSFQKTNFTSNIETATAKQSLFRYDGLDNLFQGSVHSDMQSVNPTETQPNNFKELVDNFQETDIKIPTTIPNVEKPALNKYEIEEGLFTSLSKPKTNTTSSYLKDTPPPLDFDEPTNMFQDSAFNKPSTLTYTEDEDLEFTSFEQADFTPIPKIQEPSSPNLHNEEKAETVSIHLNTEENTEEPISDFESDLNTVKPADVHDDNISQSSNHSNQHNWNLSANPIEPDLFYSNLKDNLFKTINQQDAVSNQSISPISIRSTEIAPQIPERVLPIKETSIPVIQDSIVDEKSDNNYASEYCSAWERCLTACLNIIIMANNIFSSIPSASVCNEVIYSCKGQRYIADICQVHAVVNRICSNAKTLKVVNEELLQLEKQFQLSWHNLLSFCPNAPVIEEKSSAELRDIPGCGVCLLPVSDQEIIYCECSYHASCANLWINQVEPVLPNLKLPVH